MIAIDLSLDRPEHIEFSSTNEFRDRDRILSIPGAKFDAKYKKFLAPLSWSVCIAARGEFGDSLSIGPELRQWAQDVHRTRVAPGLNLRLALDAEGDQRLYGYQRAGVQFLKATKTSLLLDDMGTGKTIQTITALRELHEEGEEVLPAVIVCPNSMKTTWEAELAKWWPEATVGVMAGSIAVRRKILATEPDIVVVNWEATRTMSRMDGKLAKVRLRRCHVCAPGLDPKSSPQSRCQFCPKELNQRVWKTVVLDEVHRMKNPKADQSRATVSLRTKETKFRFALTGTIIADNPADMWPALHFIAPEEFPSRTRFIDRYCKTWFNYWGGLEILGLDPARAEEFYKIVDPMFRRMQKEVVLPFLPPKVYSKRTMPMAPKQARAYKQIAEQMVTMLEGGHIATTNRLAQLTRLSQFSSAYAVVNEAGDVELAKPSSKIDALVDVLQELGDSSAVVFAVSRQLITLAAEELEKKKYKVGLIVGGQTEAQRAQVMRAFQAGEIQIVLSTIQAGSTGITLTKASAMIFLQRSWSNIENSQAENRAHRIGSEHESIQVIDILSEGTFENEQHQAVREKEENLQEIFRDKPIRDLLLGLGDRS